MVKSVSARSPDASRWLTVLAVTTLIVSLVLVGASFALNAASKQLQASAAGFAALVLSFSVVGLIVTLRQPRNAMGWILVGVGMCFIINSCASAYSVLDYRMHRGLPLGPVAVLVQPTWAPAIALLGLAVLLFPDSRLPSQRWRVVTWGFVGFAGLWMFGAFAIALDAIATHTIQVTSGGDLYQVDNPSGAWAWWGVVQDIFFPVLGVVWVSSLVRQIRTFRNSTGDRRLQLKWLMAGASVCVVGGFLSVPFSQSSSAALRVVGTVGTLGLLALPLSIGVAILKYRLYDIDRLISRTLSYAVVTGVLLSVYVGIVVLTTDVLSFSSPVAVAASTLAAAALFSPIRRRVQRIVDRRFNRASYNAEATVAAFAARRRGSVDLDSVLGDLLDATGRAVEPAHASIWINQRTSR